MPIAVNLEAKLKISHYIISRNYSKRGFSAAAT
jgi:hypothetical protein